MTNKTCPTCGSSFAPREKLQRFCSRSCAHKASNHSARKSRGPSRPPFIGIDGEGVTHVDPDGTVRHDYILLCCGELSLHKNGERLDISDILEFLWHDVRERYRGHIIVGYYIGGYDFAQWFASLPERCGKLLFSPEGISKRKRTRCNGNTTPFPVEFTCNRGIKWQLDILGARRFKVRPAGEKEWLYVLDVAPFFQTSFLRCIEPGKRTKAGIPELVTKHEYTIIAEGKANRGSEVFDETMIRYCQLECDVLVRLMDELRDGLTANGLHLKRTQWIGPGQAAQKWLDLVNCPKGKEIQEVTPPEALRMASDSYYGGWFEIFYHGYRKGKSYGYDINSAYPNAIAKLPCLLHGTWKHLDFDIANRRETVYSTGRYIVAEVEVYGNPKSRIGAGMLRTKQGRICRPHKLVNVQWLHELQAAQRAGLLDGYVIQDAWEYVPCDCPPPLAAIADLYRDRIAHGAAGKDGPSGVAKKLIYNSAYGKFAQSVGEPKYANPIYASLITAGCRCQILDAIATHPNGHAGVLMIATDSITFTKPHPTLPQSINLGDWAATVHENMVFFKPGVYWDENGRELLKTGALKLKSRGVNGQAFSRFIAAIDAAFMAGEWPQAIEIAIPFSVVSPRLACARGKWQTCGKVILDGVSHQSADPSDKREKPAKPGWSMPRQVVAPDGQPRRSMPYKDGLGAFGMQAEDRHLIDAIQAMKGA